MDVDDHIINLKNGAYDLNQSQLLEDRASRFLTKQATVHFKNEAICDRWLEFLFEVTDDDPDMVKQLQKQLDTQFQEIPALKYFLYAQVLEQMEKVYSLRL